VSVDGQTQLLATVELIPATLYTLMMQKNGEKMVKLCRPGEGEINIFFNYKQILCVKEFI